MMCRFAILCVALVGLMPTGAGAYAYDAEGDQSLTWSGLAASLVADDVECEDSSTDVGMFFADRSYEGEHLVVSFDFQTPVVQASCSQPGFQRTDALAHVSASVDAGSGVKWVFAQIDLLDDAPTTRIVYVMDDGSALRLQGDVYRNGSFVRLDVPLNVALDGASFDLRAAGFDVWGEGITIMRTPGVPLATGTLTDPAPPLRVAPRA